MITFYLTESMGPACTSWVKENKFLLYYYHLHSLLPLFVSILVSLCNFQISTNMIPRIRRIQEETQEGLKILKDADTIRYHRTAAAGNPKDFGTEIFLCLKKKMLWNDSRIILGRLSSFRVVIMCVVFTSCWLLLLLSTQPGSTVWEADEAYPLPQGFYSVTVAHSLMWASKIQVGART